MNKHLGGHAPYGSDFTGVAPRWSRAKGLRFDKARVGMVKLGLPYDPITSLYSRILWGVLIGTDPRTVSLLFGPTPSVHPERLEIILRQIRALVRHRGVQVGFPKRIYKRKVQDS
jgi:hypothetical protein